MSSYQLLQFHSKITKKERQSDLNPPGSIHPADVCSSSFVICLTNQNMIGTECITCLSRSSTNSVVNRRHGSIFYLPTFAYTHLFTGGNYVKHWPYIRIPSVSSCFFHSLELILLTVCFLKPLTGCCTNSLVILQSYSHISLIFEIKYPISGANGKPLSCYVSGCLINTCC